MSAAGAALAGAILLAAASRVDPPPLSGDERARLARGEVVVRRAPSGLPRLDEVIGFGVVAMPAERVMRALVDHRHYDEWVPFVVQSNARREPDGAVLHHQVLDLPAPVGDRRYTVRARASSERVGDEVVRRLRWQLVPGSGNVRAQRGEWTLRELDAGRTLAACRLVVDPGGLAPAWAVNRSSARAMPWIFDGLRQQVRRWRYDPANPTGREIGEAPGGEWRR